MGGRKRLEDLVERLLVAKPTVVATASEIPSERDIACVLAPLVRYPGDVLNSELDDMWAVFKACPQPCSVVYVPKPYSGRPGLARIAWLQELILLTQAFAPRRQRIVPKALDARVSTLLARDAKQAWRAYVRHYGATRVFERVIAGLRRLLSMHPPTLVLEKTSVVLDGQKTGCKPTPKQRIFLELLIQARGNTVTFAEFRKHGISKPDLIKARLLQRTDCAQLDAHILPVHGVGYRLGQP